MTSAGSGFLLLAAALSALASLAHVGVVIGGPGWYRFFGAGEGMAQLASRGSLYPAVITLLIAAVLGVWSAYALSGAGMLPALPLLKLVLVLITLVYTVRGLAGFVLASVAPGGNSPAFWWWSSTICLVFGIVHAIGLYRAWPGLSAAHP